MYRVIMDAFGGDNAPAAVVEGAVKALSRFDDVSIILCGMENTIREELGKHQYDTSRISILHAEEVIDCHDSPTLAIKRKKNSSLVKALEAVAAKEADAIVSAGSTGALLTGATLIVRRIKGIKRPALASLLPTRTGGWLMLIDCGANADCKPQYLQQFAVMASAYMQGVMGIKSPRVGLLNNGAEAEKGNELTKAVYPLLEEAPINFAGNCEAREILSGDYDVLVCDGFSGNVVLKYTEGLSATILAMLKDELIADTKSKIGALLAKPAFRRMKKKMDYTEVGGAPLLGINGCVIKAHGSSDAKAFSSAVMQARQFLAADINGTIAPAIEALPDLKD
ncbi:MAG: phosphate acyltransferase PlsX [Clostridiales bacterium]|nr:phosphate acyltransferase PlsX [Clostridiales bacterium]